MRLVLITALAALLAAAPGVARSEPSHGLAMHGALKYPADFAHLDYVNPDAPKGGTLRLGATGSFDSLNPFILKGKPADGARSYVFETLLQRTWDEPFSLYGLIAESVETPEDRSSVTFVLRPEARFHDGSPITVDDVIFSWETLKEQGRPNHRLYYGAVDRVEKVGERGVRFVFAGSQDREMPLIMGLMPVLSRAYYEEVTFDETTLVAPLGSGPYRIAAVDPGRGITYARADDYWGKDLPINRGLYNFDTIRIDYYRDENVLLEAFKAGDLDLVREFSGERWATAYDFPAVRDGRVVREELPHGRPSGMYGFVFNTRNPLFEDPRVREALTYAFDFEWANANLLHGLYERIDSYFDNTSMAARGLPEGREEVLLESLPDQPPQSVFTQAPELPRTDASGRNRRHLRTALALLKEAGWEVRDGALTRLSDGRTMSFEITLRQTDPEKIALAYVRSLERLGIQARVRAVESAQYQQLLLNYDYDMIIGRWGMTLSPGNEQAFYFGSEEAGREGTRNYAGVRDPAVDELIRLITAARDREGLEAAVRALDRVLLSGWYVVPLYFLTKDFVAYWAKLERPAETPLYGMVLEAWWVDPAARAGR